MKVKKYAVYKGESFVCVGTILQCAQHMGVPLETVKFYKTPAYKRRVVKRKNARNYITVMELEEDE